MLAIFLDIETTGLDPFVHKAIEIAFKIVDLSTGEELAAYSTIVKQPLEVWEKRDFKSIQINGFSWEKVQSGKLPVEVKQEIIRIFDRFSVGRKRFFFLCQNPSFDRNFFAQLIEVSVQEEKQWPYHWLDLASMYWALRVRNAQTNGSAMPETIDLSKNAVAEEYGLPAEEFPHGALNGVNHLILCYGKVIGFIGSGLRSGTRISE